MMSTSWKNRTNPQLGEVRPKFEDDTLEELIQSGVSAIGE